MFFIVGVGRSGTSLLQSILSSHSEICIPPETGFLRNSIFTFKKYSDYSVQEFQFSNKRLKRVVSPSLQKQFPPSFNNELLFYKILLENYKKGQNKKLSGDKDPRLVEFIDGVSKLFPEAYFIHLIRDPRDVLLSKKKAEWSSDKPSWYHIFANYVQLKIGEQAGKKLPVHKYTIVAYENILKTPEATIKEICNFLEVDFESSMLAFQDKAKELISEEEKQWKKETTGPLLRGNTNKWQGKLAHWEVALTETLCKQAFELGKYSKSDAIKDLPVLSRAFINIFSLSLAGIGKIYIWYRLLLQKLILQWKY